MSDITSYLFETKAIKICEENKPFGILQEKLVLILLIHISYMEMKMMQLNYYLL